MSYLRSERTEDDLIYGGSRVNCLTGKADRQDFGAGDEFCSPRMVHNHNAHDCYAL